MGDGGRSFWRLGTRLFDCMAGSSPKRIHHLVHGFVPLHGHANLIGQSFDLTWCRGRPQGLCWCKNQAYPKKAYFSIFFNAGCCVLRFRNLIGLHWIFRLIGPIFKMVELGSMRPLKSSLLIALESALCQLWDRTTDLITIVSGQHLKATKGTKKNPTDLICNKTMQIHDLNYPSIHILIFFIFHF